MVNDTEEKDKHDYQYDNDPGAFFEFFENNESKYDRGSHGAESVYEGLLPPSRPLQPIPAHHHGALGERKGGKDSRRVEGNERVNVALLKDYQQRGKQAQQPNDV